MNRKKITTDLGISESKYPNVPFEHKITILFKEMTKILVAKRTFVFPEALGPNIMVTLGENSNKLSVRFLKFDKRSFCKLTLR